MTSFPLDRNRDLQDVVERGVWGKAENVDGAGMMMSVRGTGTTDYEVPMMMFGYGFNLAENSNAEVIMVSLGSDVNDKVALPVLPRDKQHQWEEGTGGIQHPEDADRRIEFNSTDTHHTDGVHTFGPNKELTVEITGGVVTLTVNGDLNIAANNVEITSGSLTHNGTNVGDSHTHVDTAGLGAGVTSGPS